MADPTSAFFDGLARRDYEPMLAHKQGTIRVELEDGGRTERWLVTIDDGDVKVSHRNQRADSTMRAEKALFDRIVRGDTNAMAAVLRGEIAMDGDFDLLILFQRLFTAPAGSDERTTSAAAGASRS